MFTINSELEKSRFELSRVNTPLSANYLFITDLHADSTLITSEKESFSLAKNTLKYAVEFANNNDVDFLALGGDNLESYGTKEHYLQFSNELVNILKQCKKPVISVRGNHDNNKNKGQPKSEQLSIAEWKSVWQTPFLSNGCVYGDETNECTYFYYDIPNKKTRVICIDSNPDIPFEESQNKWLNENAFSVSDKGFKYIILSHKAIHPDYMSEQEKTFNCASSEVIKGIATALKNKTEYCGKDYSRYNSKLVCVNFGHSHCSFTQYFENYGCAMANTGVCGFAWPGKNGKYNAKRVWGRKLRDDGDAYKYLFDLFSVNEKAVHKIRIGIGENSTVNL